MSDEMKLLVTSSPHIHDNNSTSKIMWTVSLCLLPAALWGVFVFGYSALYVLIASIIASVGAEYAVSYFTGKNTIQDGSAFLTGLLIGFNMPPDVPLFIPMLASLFAILVIKVTFGGLGNNWMNPALAGRVFVFFSWTGPMTKWRLPKTFDNMEIADGISGASPLGFIKSGLIDSVGSFSGPGDYLVQNNYPISPFDASITKWFNNIPGVEISNGYFDLFFGNIPGCIGEISAALLIIGAVVLFVKKIITWEIPMSYIASFAALVWIFGGLRFDNGLFTGDILFNLFSGGLILGAFYMATDMVTSPLSRKGMIVYGICVGFLTFLIRFYGSFPEGVSLAIILMNIFVPMINRYTGPKVFGARKKEDK